MPIDVYGFIEVASFDDELNDPHAWRYCVEATTFRLWADDVCAILFGVSKGGGDWPAVAAGRGIPRSTGLVARERLLEVAAYQGTDQAYGFTYLTYEELKQVNWQAYEAADLSDLRQPHGGWYSLFRVMATRSERFSAQRLTVWFNS